MSSFFNVIIIGHLGKDPELRYTNKGQAVLNFSVAVNNPKKDDQGNWIDDTDWYKVTLWGDMAEKAAKVLRKGALVLIVAKRMKVEAYLNQEGTPSGQIKVKNVVKFQCLAGGIPPEEQQSSKQEEEDDDDFPF